MPLDDHQSIPHGVPSVGASGHSPTPRQRLVRLVCLVRRQPHRPRLLFLLAPPVMRQLPVRARAGGLRLVCRQRGVRTGGGAA